MFSLLFSCYIIICCNHQSQELEKVEDLILGLDVHLQMQEVVDAVQHSKFHQRFKHMAVLAEHFVEH